MGTTVDGMMDDTGTGKMMVGDVGRRSAREDGKA
jgi:hypothetical protein